MGNKIKVGFLILVILSTSMYVIFKDRLMIDVQKTRTIYSICEEPPCKYNYQYAHAGTEYIYLYDGSTKMRAYSRELTKTISGDIITQQRISKFKDNITTTQTYLYDGSIGDIEQVPLDSFFECDNCEGKIVHFEFRDIIYDGITRPATSPETFGLNMKVEWQDGYEWAKVYQQKSSDKLVIRYRPQSDHESYHVRMFDPLLNNTNISITINEPVNNSIYLTSIRLNATANDTVDLCHYAVDDGTNVTFYNRTCTQFIANESNGCGAVGGAFSTNISKWRTGGSSNPANLFDGNGSTCAYALYPNITGILYINMTKPEGVTINSTFMAYLNFTASNPPNVEQSRKNFTFGDCWNGYNNIVAFRVINNQSVAAEFMSVACWNGTDWFIKWNQTGAELIPYYCDLLVLWDLPIITNTSFSTTVGDHNVTVYCQDTNDDCVQSPYTYFTVNNTPIVKVNPNLNESPAQNYAINWILATSDLNFSDQSVIAGNFTYNISQENISIFPFNTSWLFNITNNFAVNITVSLEQNQTSNFYHWWCLNGSIKQWNITDTSLTLFDISPGESYYLNCTLDVFNISQSCTEWNCTQSGTWDFVYNITAR